MTKLKNIAIAVASLVVFTNSGYCQEVKAGYSANAEEPLKVKYLGDDSDYLIFSVTLQSDSPAKALFAIDDQQEGELYSAGLTSNFKVQTIKIEKRFDQLLNFKLVSGRKTYQKSFSVNTHLVEKTTVAESDITKL